MFYFLIIFLCAYLKKKTVRDKYINLMLRNIYI